MRRAVPARADGDDGGGGGGGGARRAPPARRPLPGPPGPRRRVRRPHRRGPAHGPGGGGRAGAGDGPGASSTPWWTRPPATSGARVTVIAPDGRVLADSAASGAELARLENHGGRPEVREALAGEVSRSERRSATVGAELLYAAVPVRRGGARSWGWPASRAGSGRSRSRARLSGGRAPSLSSSPSSPRASSRCSSPPLSGARSAEIMATARRVRAGQPLGPDPGAPGRRARRARPDHQPLGRPAPGPDGRDRARPRADRRHPRPRWTTASSPWTTAAPWSSRTRASRRPST